MVYQGNSKYREAPIRLPLFFVDNPGIRQHALEELPINSFSGQSQIYLNLLYCTDHPAAA